MKAQMRIIVSLGAIAAAAGLFATKASAATTEWWTLTSPAPLFNSTLRSVQLETGRETTWRKNPQSDPRYGFPITRSGQFTYWKYIGKSVNSIQKVGMYLANTNASLDRLVATGYWCDDGRDSCPTSKVLQPGGISPDGRKVSYRKGTSNRILNVSTGRLTILPWQGEQPVSFSPKGTFAYEWVIGEVGSTFRMYTFANGRSRSIRLPINSTGGGQLLLDISPDERYVVVGKYLRSYLDETRGYVNETKFLLLDLASSRVVDRKSIENGVDSSIVWSSKRSFVFMRDDREDYETAGSRETAVRVDVRNGKMSFHDTARNMDEPGGWQLHQPVEPGKLLVEGYQSGSGPDTLSILDVMTGAMDVVFEAKDVPSYYFFPLGPKKEQ